METTKVTFYEVYADDVKGSYTRINLADEVFDLIKGKDAPLKRDKWQKELVNGVPTDINLYGKGFDVPFISIRPEGEISKIYMLTSDITEDRKVERPSILPEGF